MLTIGPSARGRLGDATTLVCWSRGAAWASAGPANRAAASLAMLANLLTAMLPVAEGPFALGAWSCPGDPVGLVLTGFRGREVERTAAGRTRGKAPARVLVATGHERVRSDAGPCKGAQMQIRPVKAIWSANGAKGLQFGTSHT
jgi:hypothetical protein